MKNKLLILKYLKKMYIKEVRRRMIELQMWVFILLVVFGVLGVILALAIIFSGITFLIDNIKFKIQDYKDNYQKYKIYYWKHHKLDGIFEYEIDDTKEQQEQEVEE